MTEVEEQIEIALTAIQRASALSGREPIELVGEIFDAVEFSETYDLVDELED